MDLGSDPRRKNLNPFSSQSFVSMNFLTQFDQEKKRKKIIPLINQGGIYFEIEAYAENLTTSTSTSSTISANKVSNLSSQSSTMTNISKNVDYQHRSVVINDFKRQKYNTNILIDGGHFESLIQACRVNTKNNLNDDIIAVGMRVKVDNLTSLLLRTEEKKIEADIKSRKTLKRNSRNLEKEKERTDDNRTFFNKNSLNGILDSFLFQHALPPDVVVMISKPMLFSDITLNENKNNNNSNKNSENNSNNYNSNKNDINDDNNNNRNDDNDNNYDSKNNNDNNHSINNEIFPSFTSSKIKQSIESEKDPRPSTKNSTEHSSLKERISTTHTLTSSISNTILFLFRSAGLKAVDSSQFLSERLSRPPSPLTPINNQNDIDILISQCYHSKVPYLIVFSNINSFVDSIERTKEFSSNILSNYPLQVNNSTKKYL